MYRKKTRVSLDDLKRFVKIEDENRTRSKLETISKQESSANTVQRSQHVLQTNRSSRPAYKRKAPFVARDRKPPNNKLKMRCYNCNRWGHFAADCKAPKRKFDKGKDPDNSAQTNVITGPSNFAAMVGQNGSGRSAEWYLDSGATCHVCSCKKDLTHLRPSTEKVTVATGETADVTMEGEADLRLSSGKTLHLNKVLVVPSCTKNLISVSQLCKNGMSVSITGNKLTLSVNTYYFGCAYLTYGMYKLSLASDSVNQVSINLIDPNDLHIRLGHINRRKLLEVAKNHNLPLDNNKKLNKCEICAQAKITRKPFRKVSRSTSLLELIHSDICDFKSFETLAGRKYLITFIDDFSRYCHIYLLKTKDEAFSKFKEFKLRVENQLDLKIKRFRSDRGGEFTSTEFKEFCIEHGIILETTAPYSPQSNGIAERKNRTLTEMLNSMLLTAGMPSSYWGEAVLFANQILNKVPHTNLDSTPYELWHKRKPCLDNIKTWGCIAFVKIPDIKMSKVGPRTVTCVFLGSAVDSAADRFLHISTNKVIESRDAVFFETTFIKDKNITLSGLTDTVTDAMEESEPSLPDTLVPSTLTENPTGLGEPVIHRQSSRPRIPRDFGDDFVTYHIEADPKSYQEAMKSRDSLLWKEAIEDEMNSLLSNNTWVLADLPKGAKVIGCRWVLKKKLYNDKTVAKYKARLVAKGYTQVSGVDHYDTYSPVCHYSTIRILLALASIEKWIIHQMDVKTAFLHGDLSEELYMTQPEGFEVTGMENKVCKLVKSLYGLKQAPKLWHEKFDKTVKELGFSNSISDRCLYFKMLQNEVAIICLYVDDMLIIGSNLSTVNNLKVTLSNKFDMKDLGVVDTILGMKVSFSDKGISLSQTHYIDNILQDWGYQDVKVCETPYDTNSKLGPYEGTPVKQLEYSRLVGSLMYAMCCTRPDIAYTVGMLCRFTGNPGSEHWKALDRLMAYLKGTKHYALNYVGYPPELEGFSDASWNSETGDCKSTSGYVFLLGGAAVVWKSKRQHALALSSMESELYALTSSADEAEWMKDLIYDIPLRNIKINNIPLYCDNQAARTVALNKLFNSKRRSLRLKQAYLNYLLDHGVISLVDVRSIDNVADTFTKGLRKPLILKTSGQMGLQPTVS